MKQRVAILNFAGGNNYGANLTAYALLRQCESEGCAVRLMDRRFCYDFQENEEVFARFSERCFRWTSTPCYGAQHAADLNAGYDTFIVGSDQVWAYRPDWTRMQLADQRALYDLEFAASGKRRIAMAASFGGGDYSAVPEKFREARARALRSFCAISVREKSAVDICQKFLGAEAVHVLDPVFFLGAAQWGELAARDRSPLPARYAAVCLLEPGVFRPVQEKLVALWGRGAALPAVDTMRGSVEAWVRTVRQAEVVVTDSFHVTCFAIVFRKPFIYLNPAVRGTERVPSLLADLRVSFPCLPQQQACNATEQELAEVVAAARSAAYTPEMEQAVSTRIQATKDFLHRALTSAPAAEAPAFPEDAAARQREYRRWNPSLRMLWMHRLNRSRLFRCLRRLCRPRRGNAGLSNSPQRDTDFHRLKF